MTVTIKDSNGNVVGTAESISINIEYAKEKFQPADIVRDDQSNLVSFKSIGDSILVEGEVVITFKLINPNVDFTKLVEKYNVEATKVYFEHTNVTYEGLKVILRECTINELNSTAKSMLTGLTE